MKKIYLSALALAMATGANAQMMQNAQPAPKHANFGASSAINNGSAAKAVLWSNTCADDTEWTITNNLGGSEATWFWTTDPDAVPNNGPASMSTVGDGYFLIDSDSEGSTAFQDTDVEYNGVIDLSGNPNVTLSFEYNYRTYLDNRSVFVSGDNGVSWTEFVVTDGTENTGQNFSGIESIDISSVAGNMSQVKIRFHYDANWGWHWAIDDIEIRTTEDYDLRADDNIWGTVGSWGPQLPYYNVPTAQIQPINFCGTGSNIGVNDVPDATYNVDVNAGAWTSSSTPIALAASTSDTMCATAAFTPTGNGTYTAVGDISTGQNDTGVGNEDYDDIVVDVVDHIYARDNVQAGFLGGTYNQGEGFESGNIYDIFTAANIYGVQVGINSVSEVGAQIYAKLYAIDAATGDFLQQDQSDYYTVQAGDLGATINIPFLSATAGGYPLNAGESYLVVIGSDGDGGATNDLVVATSGTSEPQTTFYFDATDQTWYYTTSTSVVRMNFDQSLNAGSIDNVFGMTVFPNPAVNEATVSFELNNASDVMVTVTDLAGKVVYTNSMSNVAAGTTSVDINTNALSGGVYMVNVEANGGVSTQQLVVRK